MIVNSKLAYHSSFIEVLTAESELYAAVDCGVWRIQSEI